VRTGRQGAAAKAGHDLVIDVTSWSATLQVGEDSSPSSVELEADAGSLRVREGTGGVQALGDDDKADIQTTIDGEVLRGKPIEFRSTAVEPAEGGRLRVAGDLTLAGSEHPVEFELEVGDDGAIAGTAVVKQSDWGIKPYSALFGALKVKDEVEVEVSTG
jgi:polyisoprenoid-binding protein YceI